MPLSARNRQEGENKERSARSHEQELKRARGAISCAECRRLKLKCDKTVPCSSCRRRGCASICPNGSLTTGQGTRFILANTGRLHEKIAELIGRIRQLEDGLAILQSTVAREPHPLLSQDLLKIKSGLDLHSAAEGSAAEALRELDEEVKEELPDIDAFGTLAVRDDGAATFYGRSAGSESLLLDDKPHLTISTLFRTSTDHLNLHPEVTRLASTFPHGPPEVPVFDLQDIITGYLPPWPRAAQLRDLYLEQAPWFFGAVTERQLNEEVFPLFYEDAAEEARSRKAMGSSAEAFNLPLLGAASHASSHELALMLVVFCYGALTDSNLPPAPHNVEAERYYQLTRAALSLEPVMDRPPSVATVQVLALMGIYQGIVAGENSIETTWALMGLSSKLAQSTGLHRDPSRFKLSVGETQKRRALFWELFITDCWQALATGRLPSFELPFVDTELPADPDETLSDDGTPQPSFPAWKARWGKECVAAVVAGTLTAQPPKYSLILALDRRIREMALPKYAQDPPPQHAGLAQTMSHYMPTNYLHLTLLYVHRCFFAHALMDFPTDPMRSQYAPSFLAGYRSASALLMSVREQFSLFPTQIARFWVLWTHAFSACVMLGSVVTRGGTTKTAQAALGELRIACDLFERAATHGGRACKFVPIIRKLHEKAQAAYFQGIQPLQRDIFSPRTAEHDQDVLSIFSGRTPRTVATKSNRPQRVSPSISSNSAVVTPSDAVSPSGSPNPSRSDSEGRPSQSPAAEVFPGLDSSCRTAMHPGLVEELRSFEGQLEAQISHTNAYYAGHGPGGHQQQQQQQTQQTQQPQHSVYVEQQNTHGQQAHRQQSQAHPQLSQQQQQQPIWYQADMSSEQLKHSGAPPGAQMPQQQQSYPDHYDAQYDYAQPQVRGHPHTAEQHQHHNTDAYHQHHPPVTSHEGMSQPGASGGHHSQLHDIPLYGGVYTKPVAAATANGSANGTPAQYQDHPYAHVVANSAHGQTHDYAPYENRASAHGQSVPEQRSELWTVSAPPPDEDMSYPTSPVYEAPRMDGHAHLQRAQSQAQGAYRHPLHAAAVSDQLHVNQNRNQNQNQNEGEAQYRHRQGVSPPQPLQPQRTGQEHGHGQMQQAPQYAQGHPYVYNQVQQQQQQQMAMQMSGYSLQETWTSFIQQELPAPPGSGGTGR